MTDVAFVIPTFNRAELLQGCISSALACLPPPSEVVVVDRGSRDATEDVARSFGDCVRLIQGTPPNAATARNVGMSATSAPYIAFLDSDDESLSGKTSALAEYLDHHPGSALVHGQMEVFDRAGNTSPPETQEASERLKAQRRRGTSYPALAGSCVMYTSATLMRRSALEAVGGYDGSLPTYEDWDLYLRLALVGSLDYVDSPVARYRLWEGNVPWDRTAHGVIEVAEKHLAAPPPLPRAELEAAAIGFLARIAGSRYTLLETSEARSAALQAVRLNPKGALASREIRRALTRWVIPRKILARRRQATTSA